MKKVLLVVVFVFGLSTLTGCSSSSPTQPAGENGTPPPKDSGAVPGPEVKKGGRIPGPPK